MATYTGPSIVDYLKSTGGASDFASRTALATQKGIAGYTGTADQNTQLLGMLRAPAPVVAPTPYAGGLAPDASSNMYNTATGQPNPAYQPIPSTSLTPAVKSNFQSTTPSADVYVPPVTPTDTTTPAPLSELDKQIQGYSDAALAANNAEVGKSAYTTEQQNLAGVPEQQKLQKELTAQIVGLKSQGQAEQLQLEQNASGRGITTALLGRTQTEANRQNAIQALTLNSQLAAVQGNLQTAMDIADRAVVAKYGPIEEKLKTNLANLEIISKSPQYTAEQKAKADAQIVVQQKKLDAIATEKESAKAVNDLVIKVIANNPKIDQLSITAIKAAKTPVEAAQIASHLGLVQDKQAIPASAQEYEYAKTQGYKGTYTQYQTEDANRKALAVKQSTPYFNPTPTDKSVVATWIAQNPTESTTIDQQRLTTDSNYFYWVKAQIESQ